MQLPRGVLKVVADWDSKMLVVGASQQRVKVEIYPISVPWIRGGGIKNFRVYRGISK